MLESQAWGTKPFDVVHCRLYRQTARIMVRLDAFKFTPVIERQTGTDRLRLETGTGSKASATGRVNHLLDLHTASLSLFAFDVSDLVHQPQEWVFDATRGKTGQRPVGVGLTSQGRDSEKRDIAEPTPEIMD